MKEIKMGLPEENGAYMKVLHWFFAYPDKIFGLNELVEKLKVSKTSAKEVVERLVNEDFLKREIVGKAWRISCNQNHKFNNYRKVGRNIYLIGEVFEKIRDILPAYKSVILFGSYGKGDDNGESDIDLAVESFSKTKYEIKEICTLKNLGYRKNVSVNIHIYSRKEIDVNLFSNIANGIVIDGFLEVKNE